MIQNVFGWDPSRYKLDDRFRAQQSREQWNITDHVHWSVGRHVGDTYGRIQSELRSHYKSYNECGMKDEQAGFVTIYWIYDYLRSWVVAFLFSTMIFVVIMNDNFFFKVNRNRFSE